MESTPGVVEPGSFREGQGETALNGPFRASGEGQASSFARDRNRTVAGSYRLPGGTQHELATWGARTEQVGVNPSNERLFRRGVANASCAKRPLAWESSAGDLPRGRSLPVSTAVRRRSASGFGWYGGVLVGLPAVEVGGRHVAHANR